MTYLSVQQQLLNLQDKLYRHAVGITGNVDDAKDLLQETSLQVLNKEEKYTADTNFKAWVFTLMKNVFINNYRRSAIEQRILKENITTSFFAADDQVSLFCDDIDVSISDLRQAIMKLEDKYKNPISLLLAGYSYQEISDKTGISVGTLKSRAFEGRKKLRNILSSPVTMNY